MRPQVRSLSYLLCIAIQRIGPIIIIPLVARIGTPEDVTKYGLISSFVSLSTSIVGLRIHAAAARLMFDLDDAKERASLLLTSLHLGVVFATTMLLVGILLLYPTAYFQAVTGGDLALVVSIITLILAKLANEHFSLLLRAKGDPRSLFLVTTVEAVSFIIFIFFIYRLRIYVLDNVVYSLTLSSIFGCIAGTVVTRLDRLGGRYSFRHFKNSLIYAGPTVFGLVASWVTLQAGKWMAINTLSAADTAIITILVFYLSINSLVVRALYDGIRPEMNKAFSTSKYKEGSRLVNITFMTSVFVMSFTWISFFLWAVHFGSGTEGDSVRFMPYAVMITAFDCLALRNINLLLSVKMTMRNSISSVGGGATTIFVSLLLGEIYGVTGYLVGSAAGFAAQWLISLSFITFAFKGLRSS